jgi:hypothetical protein
MNPLNKKLVWLTLFSIAMGFMESAVVVYLREIYYPNGFSFPLVPIENDIALVEFLREAATIIMLFGIGVLTGKTQAQRLAFFIYCFAIWDIFYYVFLKMLMDWPASFMEWDILFLIPVPWVSPVIAPCMVSLTMILLALAIVFFQERGINTQFNWKDWAGFILGSLTIIASFVWDYFLYVGKVNAKSTCWTLSSDNSLFQDIAAYVPTEFNWSLFLLGEAVLLVGIVLYIKRIRVLSAS